jgi:DNA polymerase III subunit epsilon
MLSDDLVILDFETTGLSPNSGDRITEVAAIRIRKDRVVDQFESLVNCGVRLSSFIIQYTGITQKMVDSAPPHSKVVRELVQFLGRDAVIAHNASFDDRFFRSECEYARVRESVEPFICSIRVARRVYPRLSSYKLSEVARSLGISYVGRAHRAAADARLTADIVLKLARAIRARGERVRIDSTLLRRFVQMPVSSAMRSIAEIA